MKILRRSQGHSHHLIIKYINSTIQSKNIFFLKNILLQTKTEVNSTSLIETDIIILLKLLESYFFKIYLKDMDHITRSIAILNINDFIIQNLFVYAEVYDHTIATINNFKEKVNWNFCEISGSIYNTLFPKFFKKTIYRHLNYIPNDDSFLYQAVQYYYTNKDYQKANLLITKIISKEDKSDLIQDTHSICYLMLINIKINKESYGEALDYAILNLERLKEIKIKRKMFPDEILFRNYFVLGFCYSKLGDNTISFEEKNKYSQLGLASFKMALEGDPSNPIYAFYFARQLYELKSFSQAEDILSKLDEGNSNHSMIINHARSLKVLINIALLKFDKALSLCNQYINIVSEVKSLSILITIKYYLEIFKLTSFSSTTNSQSVNDEKALINKMSLQCEQVCANFDAEIAKLDNYVSAYSSKGKKEISLAVTGTDSNKSQQKSITINSNNNGVLFSEKQILLKELIKSVSLEPDQDPEKIKDEDLKSSIKIYLNEKKTLENAKM